jgi:TRAP transporter 4TM/12TM fusion protein
MPVQRRSDWAEVGRTLLRAIPFAVPIGVLLYVLMQGYSPIYAGYYATLTLIGVSLLRKETRLGPKGFVEAFELAARNAVVIAVTCASAGLVIGVVIALGVGVKFASAIFTVSGGVFWLALVMVMVGSIILGMGLPTSAAYVIVAAVAAPPLVNMGMQPLAAHLFVLYFACISSITPPVAVAAYAGAGIAGADPTRTGITAARLGVAGFIIPFIFAFWPALLMQGPWYSILHALVPAAFGVGGLAIGVIGWVFRPVGWLLRFYFIAAGMLMLVPGWWTDLVGALLFFPVLFLLRRSARERAATPALAD